TTKQATTKHKPFFFIYKKEAIFLFNLELDISPSIEEPLKGQILCCFESLLEQLNLVHQQAQ
ncbi:6410_t:CDS:1, partial [Racocetra fulgida]